MHRIVKTGFILLGLAILVSIASAYWIGIKIEQQLNHTTGVTQIDRGWFLSTAKSEFKLSNSLPPLVLRHQIQHGLIPLNELRPAFVVVNTAIGSPWCNELAILCDNYQLLHSKLAVDTVSYHQLTVPSVEIPTAQGQAVAIKNLQAYLRLPLQERAIRTTIAIEQLQTVIRGQQTLSLSGLQLQGQVILTNGFVNADMQLSVRDSELGGETLQSASTKIRLAQIYEPGTRHLASLWKTQFNLDTLLQLQELLQNNPRLQVEELQIKTSRGLLEANGQIQLHALNPLTAFFNPLQPIKDAAATIIVDKELLEWILQYINNGQQQLAYWQQMGFIRLQNGRYHCELRIEQGQVLANNKTGQ